MISCEARARAFAAARGLQVRTCTLPARVRGAFGPARRACRDFGVASTLPIPLEHALRADNGAALPQVLANELGDGGARVEVAIADEDI